MMNIKHTIARNIGLMVIFGALGLTMFNENLRTVEIVRLFACGTGFGAALTTIIFALKSKQTKP
jgi:hypothetical protein